MGIFDKLGKKQDDKPRADFSDVQSGSSTTAAEPQRPAPTSTPGPIGTAGQGQSYTVVSGDSLSKIARRVYGDANEWRRIYEANRDQIKDPDLIHPGQQLKIPGA